MNTNVTLSMHHGRVPAAFYVGILKLTLSIGKAYTVSVDRLQPAYVLADFAVEPTRCAPPLPACDVSRAVCNYRRVTPASRKCGKFPSMDTRSSTPSPCASQNATNDASFATSSPSPSRVHTHTRTRAVRRPAFFRP